MPIQSVRFLPFRPSGEEASTTTTYANVVMLCPVSIHFTLMPLSFAYCSRSEEEEEVEVKKIAPGIVPTRLTGISPLLLLHAFSLDDDDRTVLTMATSGVRGKEEGEMRIGKRWKECEDQWRQSDLTGQLASYSTICKMKREKREVEAEEEEKK
ncbi:hypothetical protein GCK72_018560 [Caenorhabditis remanei]|uniref:Uncharacterized protein n=1 Tax=Caenorhabditis remanei TaxID=31234 RepID=A0A6A5GB10_CAERE|nr:hypothetical protein GCK72_018560 [Caenorhabditis remanei]KAF1752006.1 hypothetical protein GCK72_018560 [Caenorhabditis remanei]